MHSQVVSAISALQRRALNEHRAREGDILEEALSDLVRNPNRANDADHQVGSSIARARTKIRRRETLAPVVARVDEQPEDPEAELAPVVTPATSDDNAHELIAVRDAVARSELAARDRTYLSAVSVGLGAEEIAELEREPLTRIRVRLSRAQRRGRDMWERAA